ncbi:GMC family oxidoreductase N-terminal domain-containing protein [Streptomyces sp. NPDC048290]|uniref:GMC family oxidoreductase n=1 Tax=Streptomyces sp. NPDC048290 TaxID=3155811 RepID=UPI00343D07B0
MSDQVMTEKTNAGYDVIVVGGGTAGCVLAARLSEQEDLQVLLLEAGPPASELPDAVTRPSAWPGLATTPANWGDSTVPQSASGAPVPLPRGRGLGGSSAINAMVFARGHHTSYGAWSAHGAKGWTFVELLPYFQRTETVLSGASARGTQGPLTVAPATEPHDVLLACLEGALATGHSRARDISGGLETGFAPVDLNIVDGRRQSAADAYLTPALGRPNLQVETGAVAHRLLFDGTTCTGVEYDIDGRLRTATASREVVLTAGTIGSAHLLLRSGVGPEDTLRQAQVEVLHQLPGVGANLHDHPRANLVHCVRRPVPTPRGNHGEIIGLLSSGSGLHGPDIQLIFIDIPLPNPVAAVSNGFTIGVSPMRPASRGSLRITSADPYARPVLDPRYFAEEADVQTVLAGIRTARRIAASEPLAAWGAEEVAPGPDIVTDNDVAAYAKRYFSSYCHPVGTCLMGEDDVSVVDSELRVRGLTGLRVADASVIPAIPSANTNATVYALAERAAELLLRA